MPKLAHAWNFFKEVAWLAGLLVAVIFWVQNSISASADKVEKGMRSYVDIKHQGVENKLNSIEQVINRIDERVYQINRAVR